MLDPHDGEIRAMASRRTDPRSSGSPALSEPFEPGSTLKPLMAAQLLQQHRARPDEIDEHRERRSTRWTAARSTTSTRATMSLADVIRYSSNIGIVKFTSRFSRTGEVRGAARLRLRHAHRPSVPGRGVGHAAAAEGLVEAKSPASLAMGYEMAVTPLQLAAAYVPVANGGELLEPALVKEIRAPDGTVRYHHSRAWSAA